MTLSILKNSMRVVDARNSSCGFQKKELLFVNLVSSQVKRELKKQLYQTANEQQVKQGEPLIKC